MNRNRAPIQSMCSRIAARDRAARVRVAGAVEFRPEWSGSIETGSMAGAR